jgi:hypothetical protein
MYYDCVYFVSADTQNHEKILLVEFFDLVIIFYPFFIHAPPPFRSSFTTGGRRCCKESDAR